MTALAPPTILFNLDDAPRDRAPTFEKYVTTFRTRYPVQREACDEKFLRESVVEAIR